MRKIYVVLIIERMEFQGYQFFDKDIDAIYSSLNRAMKAKLSIEENLDKEKYSVIIKTEVLL